jgi:hypothetical protein
MSIKELKLDEFLECLSKYDSMELTEDEIQQLFEIRYALKDRCYENLLLVDEYDDTGCIECKEYRNKLYIKGHDYVVNTVFPLVATVVYLHHTDFKIYKCMELVKIESFHGEKSERDDTMIYFTVTYAPASTDEYAHLYRHIEHKYNEIIKEVNDGK